MIYFCEKVTAEIDGKYLMTDKLVTQEQRNIAKTILIMVKLIVTSNNDEYINLQNFVLPCGGPDEETSLIFQFHFATIYYLLRSHVLRGKSGSTKIVGLCFTAAVEDIRFRFPLIF